MENQPQTKKKQEEQEGKWNFFKKEEQKANQHGTLSQLSFETAM